MFKNLIKKLLFVFLCLQGATACAQLDTLVELKEVHVVAVPEQKATPIQTLGPGQIEKIQALNVADAVKHFSGVMVKDYGGIGGLKTVSVRGMGASHTGVTYDGVQLSDSQTGQIDIGKFSMDNISSVSLVNGGPDDIFRPARSYSTASLLQIKSLSPKFEPGEVVHGRLSFKTGSFGLINPSLLIQNKLSNSFRTSVHAEWMKADGKYPFRLENGSIISKEKRINTDVESFGGEVNLFKDFGSRHHFSLKTNFYESERGLPGAIIYYNPHSSQRLWDRNLFFQGNYESELSAKLRLKLNGKYYTGYLRYLDPHYLGSEQKIENIFRQKEGYFSVASLYKLVESFQVSAATDLIYNTMDANLYQFVYPSRYTWLSNLSTKYSKDGLTLSGNILYTLVDEEVKSGNNPELYKRWSPTLTAGYAPGNGKVLIRFFYKEIYRMPTFNDLYYTGIGNAKLKPETTRQFNLGAAYFIRTGKNDNSVYLTTDLYYNKVKDKIIAMPTKNTFLWSMRNLGLVDIMGGDISIKSNYRISPQLIVSLFGSYSYQQVLDKTDPKGKTYKHQIAYTPVHSGSGTFSLETSWVNVSYNVIFSGDRYRLNENIKSNYLKGYAEHGISLSKGTHFKGVEIHLKGDLINIFNTQYEVINSFPMPGRSVRMTLSARI